MWFFEYIDFIEDIPWNVRLLLVGAVILILISSFVSQPPENKFKEQPPLIKNDFQEPINQPFSEELGWQLIITPLLGL